MARDDTLESRCRGDKGSLDQARRGAQIPRFLGTDLALQASLAQAVAVLQAQYELTMRVYCLADSSSTLAFVRPDGKAELRRSPTRYGA